jgi:fatty-acyl-CoA synthase
MRVLVADRLSEAGIEALAERFENFSVDACLRLQAEELSGHPFIVFRNRRLTYRQVDSQSDALAAALHELGIEAGDRIALTLPNWPELVVSAFAAAKLGATLVPLNPKYTTPELQYMLRHSEAAAVITAENWEGVDYLARFENFLTSLPDLQYVISVGEEDLWYDDRIYQFEDLLSSGEGRPYPRPEIDPKEDLFAIVYTSGTMGKPKGVSLTHTNLISTAALTSDTIELRADDVVFGLTSLYNVFGLGPGMLGTTLAGAAMVLQDTHDPREALEILEREQVTVHHGVPTTFITELRQP